MAYDHDEAIRRATREERKLIPFAVLVGAVGIFGMVFLQTDLLFTSKELPGLARHVWLLAAIVVLGLSGIAFVGSLMSVIVTPLVARRLREKVSTAKLLARATVFMLIGFALFSLFIFLHGLIISNARELNELVNWEFEGLRFVIGFVVYLFACYLLGAVGGFIFLLVSLPAQAEQIAKEIDDQS